MQSKFPLNHSNVHRNWTFTLDTLSQLKTVFLRLFWQKDAFLATCKPIQRFAYDLLWVWKKSVFKSFDPANQLWSRVFNKQRQNRAFLFVLIFGNCITKIHCVELILWQRFNDKIRFNFHSLDIQKIRKIRRFVHKTTLIIRETNRGKKRERA